MFSKYCMYIIHMIRLQVFGGIVPNKFPFVSALCTTIRSVLPTVSWANVSENIAQAKSDHETAGCLKFQ